MTIAAEKRMQKQINDWVAGMPVKQFCTKYSLTQHYYKAFAKKAKSLGLKRELWHCNEMGRLMEKVVSQRQDPNTERDTSSVSGAVGP